ncbi:bMERB domain-containing protein 1 [Rhinichthys klamathensis goyatoka]|uniref:bMERB domain-containing protein 1 n=1 Tax=Rhinichthys klamathensis goyatoka TaxID=3034132 RepID=UPI0024B56146|nr:bMERB domain-containing protein 1 [Rhinichthys klamathensis goyatoka]
MEKGRSTSKQYGSLDQTELCEETGKQAEEDVVSMADSTITVEDIEGELFKIERIKDALVRKESELRYMMDDIQLCKEITRLKKELQKLVSIPDKEKSNEDRQREEELFQQIQKLVETRDFLVDDMEFERLREREEDNEMADFLQTKFPNRFRMKSQTKDKRMTSRAQQTSSPYVTKTGVTLLKGCCGFTCSVM